MTGNRYDKDQPASSRASRNTKEEWENQPCSTCRAAKFAGRCPGHDLDLATPEETEAATMSSQSHPTSSRTSSKEPGTAARKDGATAGNVSTSPRVRLSPEIKRFDSDIILELLSSKALQINDNGLDTLTIRLVCVPPDDTKKRKEFDNFVEALLTALEEFKKKNGIEKNCLKVEATDKKGMITAFRIELTPTHYKNFMTQLTRNQLLPTPSPFAKKEEEQEPVANVTKTPRPRLPGSGT